MQDWVGDQFYLYSEMWVLLALTCDEYCEVPNDDIGGAEAKDEERDGGGVVCLG